MKVQGAKDSAAVTIQTALDTPPVKRNAAWRRASYARRGVSRMTKSGEHDATTIFFYDGHKIVDPWHDNPCEARRPQCGRLRGD